MVATNEQVQFHTLLSQLILFSSLPIFIVTRFLIVAPFGKHAPKKQHDKQNNGQSKYRWWFGPSFNARMSWFLFESPNLIWSWYCCWYWCDPNIFFLDPSQKKTAISLENNDNHLQISTNVILMSLFTLHYINRAIIYPLRMNSNSQKVPLLVSASASFFTIWNGYLQCFYLVQIEKLPPLSLSPSLDNIQRCAGICLFFVGMGINVHSDGVLRNLRRHGPTGKLRQREELKQQVATQQQHAYHIPYSPCFTHVSCPNFAGEMLEWLGFSMASQFSLPSVAFVVYTAGNLIPRAIAHHDWYKSKFDDYPVERKAVIPFIV